jgi:FMN phosphatase YigB (HAD superfamily)
MMLELFKFILGHPVQGFKTAYLLREFRAYRESLRGGPRLEGPLEQIQYEQVASRMKVPVTLVEDTVEEWIMLRPLKHLRKYRRRGVESFLEQCRDNDIRIGAFSDYPSSKKLEAMEISSWFNLNLCSTDPDINTFKPSPAGILLACRIWGLAPGELLYIGDRAEIDGVAATAAGTRFILVGQRSNSTNIAVRNFRDLGDFL